MTRSPDGVRLGHAGGQPDRLVQVGNRRAIVAALRGGNAVAAQAPAMLGPVEPVFGVLRVEADRLPGRRHGVQVMLRRVLLARMADEVSQSRTGPGLSRPGAGHV